MLNFIAKQQLVNVLYILDAWKFMLNFIAKQHSKTA